MVNTNKYFNIKKGKGENMKNELLKNKIIDSIASKTVSDNLIFLSIAMLKHKNYIVVNNYSKKQSKYGENIEFLRKAAVNNGISEDIIGKKVNSITAKSYVDCISLKQALKISGMCNRGDYTYDKNYLPDAICGFVSDEECASMLKDFGFSPEDNVIKNNDIDTTTNDTASNSIDADKIMKIYINGQKEYMERHYEIIDNLQLLTWRNKRIMISSQIVQIFDVSYNVLMGRFRKSIEDFKYGEDYYKLDGKEVKELGEVYGSNGSVKSFSSVYIWTASGVLLFAKILSSDCNILNPFKYEENVAIYQYLVEKYFSVDVKNEIEKKELIETYTPSINDIQITSNTESNQQQSLSQPEEQPESLKTPIEIALGIDADGKTTAKKLYEFLELNPRNYARWCKTNITKNLFAEESVDYEGFDIDVESKEVRSSSMKSEKHQPNPSQDFKLSANFAKKLSMQGKTERAEQAREYFIRVEDSV